MAGPWEQYQEKPWSKYDRRGFRATEDISGDINARNSLIDKGVLTDPSLDPTAGMSEAELAKAGVGKAITDAGRGIAQLIPGSGVSGQDVAESRTRDKALMNTTAGFTGNTVGNVGMAMAPGGMAKGAGVALRAAGMPEASSVASQLGGALLAPKSVPAGLAFGATQGAMAPAADMTERAVNTAAGGVANAVAPVLSASKAAIEPFYDSGRRAIMGRVLNRAAGGEANAVQSRLAAALELVPGSKPTAGQAANNAGVAALERAAFAAEPSVTVPVANRMKEQNIARAQSLQSISGTDKDREMMSAVRDMMSEQLYKEARQEGIPKAVAAANQPLIDNLLERMPKGVLEKAQELARIKGESFGQSGSVSGLHWVKQGIDDLISGTPETGTGKLYKEALTQYKKDLVTTLGELSPKYDQARTAFASWSKPINAMEVGQAFADKSSALTGKLKPEQFAQALRNGDDIAAKATGFKGSTLENTLDPQQVQKLNAVKDDLARATAADNAGRGAGSDTVQKMAYTNLMQQSGLDRLPNLLNRPVQLVEYVSRAVYGSANKEMQKKLAEALLNPQEAAAMMREANPSKRSQMLGTALRGVLTAPAMATPAMLNANQ